MIKKIQQYILTHYPTLWNIRLLPMLLIMLGVHLFFYLVGYFSADASITNAYYYSSPSSDIGLWYAFSILIGILLFIGWLIFYMRNNALKVFYPRKIVQLYGEWLLIFFILLSLSLFPLTLTHGNISRWRSLSSYNDTQKTLEMLEKVKVIIPSDINNYNYDRNSGNEPIRLAQNEVKDMSKIDMDLYAFEYDDRGSVILRGYIGPSVLFYHDSDFSYLNIDTNNLEQYDDNGSYLNSKYIRKVHKRAKEKEQVINWFKNGQQDSIRLLMTDFMNLAQKHKLQQDVSIDRWFNMVYQSPYFAISENNIICDQSSYYYSNPCNMSLPRASLDEYYQKIQRSYEDDFSIQEYLLLSACVVAMVLSVLVFSYRVTSGRSWLLAFVFSGVLMFLITLIGFFLSNSASYRSETVFFFTFILLWISIFVGIIIFMLYKIFSPEDNNKGRVSAILLNMGIWLIPFITPLLYTLYITYGDIVSGRTPFVEDDFIFLLWINLPIIAILMLPIVIVIRKWKSLSDE